MLIKYPIGVMTEELIDKPTMVFAEMPMLVEVELKKGYVGGTNGKEEFAADNLERERNGVV